MHAFIGSDIYTPVELAIDELRRRRQQSDLASKVANYLNGDIPDYLLKNDCFVLPRHIATPNNEAIYVLEKAKQYGALAVFSQDPKDKFTSVNNLKRRLARPEVFVTTGGREEFKKIDLVDIPLAEGRILKDIQIRRGQNLVGFHNFLFQKIQSDRYIITDESNWIDRNNRGDLILHYTKFLSLFVVYGVIFDDFESENDFFLKSTVLPSVINFIYNKFGYFPLLVRSASEDQKYSERFYLSHCAQIMEI